MLFCYFWKNYRHHTHYIHSITHDEVPSPKGCMGRKPSSGTLYTLYYTKFVLRRCVPICCYKLSFYNFFTIGLKTLIMLWGFWTTFTMNSNTTTTHTHQNTTLLDMIVSKTNIYRYLYLTFFVDLCYMEVFRSFFF